MLNKMCEMAIQLRIVNCKLQSQTSIAHRSCAPLRVNLCLGRLPFHFHSRSIYAPAGRFDGKSFNFNLRIKIEKHSNCVLSIRW